jgi:hypothetical protein
MCPESARQDVWVTGPTKASRIGSVAALPQVYAREVPGSPCVTPEVASVLDSYVPPQTPSRHTFVAPGICDVGFSANEKGSGLTRRSYTKHWLHCVISRCLPAAAQSGHCLGDLRCTRDANLYPTDSGKSMPKLSVTLSTRLELSCVRTGSTGNPLLKAPRSTPMRYRWAVRRNLRLRQSEVGQGDDEPTELHGLRGAVSVTPAVSPASQSSSTTESTKGEPCERRDRLSRVRRERSFRSCSTLSNGLGGPNARLAGSGH